MDKRILLDRVARDAEERLLFSRLLDQAERCARRQVPTHSFFLSPGERAAAESVLRAFDAPRFVFRGGYAEAERTVCLFLPDWQEEEDAEAELQLLRVKCFEENVLGHRDVLGSLMGLGVNREKLGDILVAPDGCDLIILPEIGDFLMNNWESAGRAAQKDPFAHRGTARSGKGSKTHSGHRGSAPAGCRAGRGLFSLPEQGRRAHRRRAGAA